MKDIKKLLDELTWGEQVEIYNAIRFMIEVNHTKNLIEDYCNQEGIPVPDIPDSEIEDYVAYKLEQDEYSAYYEEIPDGIIELIQDFTEEEEE